MANTPLHQIEKMLGAAFPEAAFEMSRPARANGVWQLDVVWRGNWIAAQWKQGGPIGLASPEGQGYGQKPDERFDTAEEAAARIARLLLTGGRTEAPLEVTLRELRAERKLSQVALAERMGVQQPTVSRFESRVKNMMIETIETVIRALGGRLALTARFPDGAVREIALERDGAADDLESVATTK